MVHETWRHITQTEVWNSKVDKNAGFSHLFYYVGSTWHYKQLNFVSGVAEASGLLGGDAFSLGK
jgi:hypothetical protein